jgi:AbrB family looped-hinge helix DNA binding protein
MRTTIDSAGRVVIPKSIRESAGLKAGPVNIECREGKVELEPIYKDVKWVRKRGFTVAVAPAGTPWLTNEQVRRTLRGLRDERLRKHE